MQHQVQAAGFEARTVNHFTAAVRNGVVVAVFNDRTNTVQVFAQDVPTFGCRQVKVTKGNDARCMFA